MRNQPTPHFRKTSPAFTRLELLACVAACALVLAIITPALANSRSRSDRVACFSNLRQIGTAFRQFAIEHDGNPAWTALAGADGNYGGPGKFLLWFQYWWLRDLLGTPKILMDPAETRSNARVATEWGLVPESGLQSLKNRAVAYGLGRGYYEGYEFKYTELPQTIIALDRNFVHSGFAYSGSFIGTVEVGPASTGWRDEIHGEVGNVAFADGSVDSLTTEKLQQAVRRISSRSIRVFSAAEWD
jgi:prepilin-type processing-associated H-X9-DG protein